MTFTTTIYDGINHYYSPSLYLVENIPVGTELDPTYYLDTGIPVADFDITARPPDSPYSLPAYLTPEISGTATGEIRFLDTIGGGSVAWVKTKGAWNKRTLTAEEVGDNLFAPYILPNIPGATDLSVETPEEVLQTGDAEYLLAVGHLTQAALQEKAELYHNHTGFNRGMIAAGAAYIADSANAPDSVKKMLLDASNFFNGGTISITDTEAPATILEEAEKWDERAAALDNPTHDLILRRSFESRCRVLMADAETFETITLNEISGMLGVISGDTAAIYNAARSVLSNEITDDGLFSISPPSAFQITSVLAIAEADGASGADAPFTPSQVAKRRQTPAPAPDGAATGDTTPEQGEDNEPV